MSSTDALRDGQQIVRIVAQTALDNETYFGELDAVVGDGDLGYSLARGFSKLLEGWDEMEYEDVGGLLKKTALVLTSRIGGTSGPIWGTAFLRAGVAMTPTPDPSHAEVVAALRAGLEGIKQRGGADLGEKTLIDALQPAFDRLEQVLNGGGTPEQAVAEAATVAAEAAAATKGMLAMRGRAAYTGERSRDSVDAGATAVAVIFKAVSESWTPSSGQPAEGSTT